MRGAIFSSANANEDLQEEMVEHESKEGYEKNDEGSEARQIAQNNRNRTHLLECR
jgi:hypothetical protein